LMALFANCFMVRGHQLQS